MNFVKKYFLPHYYFFNSNLQMFPFYFCQRLHFFIVLSLLLLPDPNFFKMGQIGHHWLQGKKEVDIGGQILEKEKA